jgi:NTP pyrophosphatase (non-canonical NTP hydrolase)
MSRSVDDLTDLLVRVSDIYAERVGFERSDDWFLLKIQEELGELTAEHLRLSGRGRQKGMEKAAIERAREDELADLFAFVLLYAQQNDIDLPAALERKWFQYLPPQA